MSKILSIPAGAVNPYDRRRSKFFKRLVDRVGSMKKGEQLQVRINSYSMVTKAKLRIRSAYPGIANDLEIFSRTLSKGRFLYVRFKNEK